MQVCTSYTRHFAMTPCHGELWLVTVAVADAASSAASTTRIFVRPAIWPPHGVRTSCIYIGSLSCSKSRRFWLDH